MRTMRATALLPLPFLLLACGDATPPSASGAASTNPTTTLAESARPPVSKKTLPYPATRKEDIADKLFGVTVPDPYRWLEDGKSPEVQAWMKAEDDLARAELAKLPERDAFAARLK